MKKVILLSFAILTAGYSFAQKKGAFLESPKAYLGQIPPGDTPKIFAPGVLTEKGAWAGDRVALSPDGKEFYYAHNTSWFNSDNLKLKYFKYARNKWNGPFVLARRYYAPVFSKDGNTIYFIGGPATISKSVVSWSHRTDTGWSAPSPYIKTPYRLYDFIQTDAGNMYAGTNGTWGPIANWQTYNIAQLTIKNGDTTVTSLGAPVNAPGFNGDFFIAPDESYMIISNRERQSFECELAISYHKPDGNWTNPKSLGPLINCGVAHRWGEYVSPDGKYLFYTHGHSAQTCFLYWVRFDKLKERLKHTNFDPYVKQPLTAQTARSGKAFVFTIPDATFFDDDGNGTLEYSAMQENGKPLPDGLSFDPTKKSIAGTPVTAGEYIIKVAVVDTANAMASSSFILTVKYGTIGRLEGWKAGKLKGHQVGSCVLILQHCNNSIIQ